MAHQTLSCWLSIIRSCHFDHANAIFHYWHITGLSRSWLCDVASIAVPPPQLVAQDLFTAPRSLNIDMRIWSSITALLAGCDVHPVSVLNCPCCARHHIQWTHKPNAAMCFDQSLETSLPCLMLLVSVRYALPWEPRLFREMHKTS
nr:hypothetical protein CFP56_21122 [Quercus suber]